MAKRKTITMTSTDHEFRNAINKSVKTVIIDSFDVIQRYFVTLEKVQSTKNSLYLKREPLINMAMIISF